MKHIRLFLINVSDALTERSRQFVWFCIALINPMFLLLFWSGAFRENPQVVPGWTRVDMFQYYLLLVVVNSLIQVHVEEVIAYVDIREGRLSQYLLKPMGYHWFSFFSELPYRIIQGLMGIGIYVGSMRLLHMHQDVSVTFFSVFSVGIVFVLAYCLSFMFKMILGLTALWTTDFSGLSQFVGVVILIFGGFVIPVDFYPPALSSVATALPFSSMFYYPIAVVLGKLTAGETAVLIMRQCIWLGVFVFMYRFIWQRGIKKFTGVGM